MWCWRKMMGVQWTAQLTKKNFTKKKILLKLGLIQTLQKKNVVVERSISTRRVKFEVFITTCDRNANFEDEKRQDKERVYNEKFGTRANDRKDQEYKVSVVWTVYAEEL